MNNLQREKEITKTSIVGIIINFILVAFKIVAGLLSSSIAIVLDAINNFSDALGSLITIGGIKLSKMKPNKKHPYGYGRIEYLSSILIAFIILYAGISSIAESIKSIINPEVAEYSYITVIIMIASIITKLVLGKYFKNKGKKYNSDALVGSGVEATFDSLISASTIIGIFVTFVFNISIDGYIGLLISIFIIKAGFTMLQESLGNIMGNRYDDEITKEIKELVRSIPGVIGAYDLILHDYGVNVAIGSIHIEVDASSTLNDFHKLTKTIQTEVYEKFNVVLTVGCYAIDEQDSQKVEMYNKIKGLVKDYEGVINVHGIYIDLEAKEMSFDITVDFTLKDQVKLVRSVKEKILDIYPNYKIMIKLDANYSY